MPPVRLEPATHRSPVKHYITEKLKLSLDMLAIAENKSNMNDSGLILITLTHALGLLFVYHMISRLGVIQRHALKSINY